MPDNANTNNTLPFDWQEQLAAMIRGVAPARADWLAPGHGLAPEAQLAVYREQYRLRLSAALEANYPGLCALLGGCAGHTLLPVLEEHPSRSFTLERVGLELPEWLESRGAAPEQVDMARLDRAIAAGFNAADGAPLQPDTLTPHTPLRLAPHVTLLRVGWSVHAWRAQALGGEDPAPLQPGDFPLVVYRRERRMRHLVLPPAAWELVRALDGRSLAQGLEAALAAGADAGELAAGVGSWMQLFAGRGLLVAQVWLVAQV